MRKLLLSLSLFVLASNLSGQSTDRTKVFNVKSYGALGDSITMETKAIQAAIDACTESGGGTVWVPAGKYHIGTIWLKSNVTLSLDYGAYLLGSQDIDDYDRDLPKPRDFC